MEGLRQSYFLVSSNVLNALVIFLNMLYVLPIHEYLYLYNYSWEIFICKNALSREHV